MRKPPHYFVTIVVLLVIGCLVVLPTIRAEVTLHPKAVPANTVIVMFDDGWDDQFTTAVPILQNLGLKATFDVYPAAMDGEWSDFMSWSQVEWLAQNGFDVESHTYSHQDLNNLSQATLTDELTGSKEAFLNHRIQTGELALPYGDGADNTTVLQAAKNAGYLIVRSDEVVLDTTGVTYSTIQINDMNNATTVQYLNYLLTGAQVSVLIYHHINTDTSDIDSVTPTNFTAQMNYLKTNGYNVLTMRDMFFDITPLPSPTPTPEPTATPSSSATPIASPSPSPSPSPTATASPKPTDAPTDISPTQSPTNNPLSNLPQEQQKPPLTAGINYLGLAALGVFIVVCATITAALRLRHRSGFTPS